jgi:hypothetical protein
MDALAELPENTVAAFRLPLSVQRISDIFRMFIGVNYHVAQVGDWIVVTKEGGRP